MAIFNYQRVCLSPKIGSLSACRWPMTSASSALSSKWTVMRTAAGPSPRTRWSWPKTRTRSPPTPLLWRTSTGLRRSGESVAFPLENDMNIYWPSYTISTEDTICEHVQITATISSLRPSYISWNTLIAWPMRFHPRTMVHAGCWSIWPGKGLF